MMVPYPEPFDGYEYTDNYGGVHNALHDEWKARLQERAQLGAHEKEESCKIFMPQKVGKIFVKKNRQEYTHHEKITG